MSNYGNSQSYGSFNGPYGSFAGGSSNPYAPYGGGQNANSNPSGQSGAQAGSGTLYNPGGGSLQDNATGSGFNPVGIPSTFNPVFEAPLEPVTGTPQTGAIPAPLYARPTAKPGEFELFQKPPPQRSEFETFVDKSVGKSLPRFGENLVLEGSKGFVTPSTAVVPPSYVLNPGDELHVGATGAVEANLNLTVDSEGRIFVPRIGAIDLAGVRYGDLAAAIKRRFNDQYKHVEVSAIISRLHGLTVYVTGSAVSPGAYTVSSLSTMANAVLAAGGPAPGGSYRIIELRRGGELVSRLDLYDLLINGDKSHDAVLQNQDVLDIRPTGPELAITGSVNDEAIFEAKAGESLGDMIKLAGGPNSLADRSRIVVSSLADLDQGGSQQLTFAQAATTPARAGDIVRILSLANMARPIERQAILATIDGEVDHPGRYYLPPGSTLADLLRVSGGETSGAFVYGSVLDRVSVQRQQKINFDRVIEDLRLAAATEPLTQNSSSAVSGDRTARSAEVSQGLLSLVNELHKEEPKGRIVLPISYEAPSLPAGLRLENLDSIYIPPTPTAVGVFGLVYQQDSYLFVPGKELGDYLRQAGGPRDKTAAVGEIMVVRANGSVISRSEAHNLLRLKAQPGDVIFVPVRTGPTLFDRLLAASQLVFQYGVGLGALALSFSSLGVHL